jgi:hypothetical protein
MRWHPDIHHRHRQSLAARGFEALDRGMAIAHRRNLVATLPEHTLDQPAQKGLVVCDEDALAA